MEIISDVVTAAIIVNAGGLRAAWRARKHAMKEAVIGMFKKSSADDIARGAGTTRAPQQSHGKARRRGAAIGLTAVGATAALLFTALPALAFNQYGPSTEINCNESSWNTGSNTCGSIPSHSTQFWIQSQIQCDTENSASYQVVDQSNGAVVASGSCSWFQDSSIITTYGLYGMYYVRISGSGTNNAMIRNCTSGCAVVNM